MEAFTKSALLLFVLLNPFILSVYLLALVKALPLAEFVRQLSLAGLISLVVFVLFAWGGEAIFDDVLQVRFASFLVFGGITFLIVGTRLILGGDPPVDAPGPNFRHTPAAIAMPFLIGPGTISASVLAGSRLDLAAATAAIAVALVAALGAMLGIKALHDFVRTRNEALIARYSEIAGRVTALFTGSFVDRDDPLRGRALARGRWGRVRTGPSPADRRAQRQVPSASRQAVPRSVRSRPSTVTTLA